MDAINEIKSRLPIEELVSQYVQLKKVGRSFKALCPFHKERTPSFHVSPEKQLAYCFGCHKGGDQFKFIQEIEGLDFKGALQFLAEKTNVELPKKTFEQAATDSTKKSQRDRLISAHEEAVRFFEEKLWDTDEGKQALKYLKKRGMNEDFIKQSRLGFSPNSENELYNFLLKKDFTREEILGGGLAIARDTGSSDCVDRFRGRLMFPIKNLAGGIIAFGGRALKEGQEPKYLNSPETLIYYKSSVLYGLFEARNEIRTSQKAILVEGYMDALAMQEFGIKNAVACSGTSLTEGQLATLKRFTKEIIFAFDRDEAGQLATERGIELAFLQDFSVRAAIWEKYKDPDECLRENKEIFLKAVDSATTAMNYLISRFKYIYNINTPDGKRKFVSALLPFLSKIKSPIERDEWVRKCSNHIEASVSSFYDELKLFEGKQKKILKKDDSNIKSDITVFNIYEYLLGLILTYPELRSMVNQFVTPEDFEENDLQNIYRSIQTTYNQEELSGELIEKVNILSMFVENMHADSAWSVIESEAINLILSIVKKKHDREKRKLITSLRNAQGNEKKSLLESYQELLSREEDLISRIQCPKN